MQTLLLATTLLAVSAIVALRIHQSLTRAAAPVRSTYRNRRR